MKRMASKILAFLFVLTFAVAALPAAKSSAATGTVTVTLEILYNSASYSVTSGKYYVTAYSDSACTNAVSTKSISLSNQSSNSVSFSGLNAGTYYFAESNSSGTLKTDTSNLTISYPTGNTVTVSEGGATQTLRIQNNYTVDPNTVSAKTADENQPVLFASIAVLCVLVGGAVVLKRTRA